MSERRRRRLADEQRRAEERALAEAERATPTPAVTPEIGVSADATPVAFEPPPVPTRIQLRENPAPSGRHAYLVAGVASALWVGGVAAWLAFEVGSGAVELEPLRLAVYALIALAPAGMAIMLAHAVRQGAGLAAETRRARELSEALIAPTALAAQQTGEVLHSLRNDIDQASLAAERARHDMALLREALSQETTRLNEAAEAAGRTARRLAEQLGDEREKMQVLATRMDDQASGVIEAVERQSRMVVDASDLAQTQLREAEAALAARAADLAAAASEAQDAARVAADDLARQTLRLENAGSGVAEQIQSVEEGLGQQRAALVTAAYALRTDQEDFSAQVESQRAQLSEQLSATRTAAGELGDTSTRTTETIKDLVEAATDQFRALVEMSQREADGFDAATKLALDRFEALAAEARDALVEETRSALSALQATAEESRAAATDAAEQAQVRADRLGEALFEAAQKADQAADARVDSARKIVIETSGLVDEAGDRALERLESTVDRMNAALAQIDETIGDLDERAARLPEEAQKRVEAVRVSVEEGLAALAAASQKAAADTEALDAGFQERVRRNYDMLTEAVRLMGVVSGDTPALRRREPLPAAGPATSEADSGRSRAARGDEARGFGLRGRLKLEPMPGSAAPVSDRLDWNDLVDDGPGETPLDLDTPMMPAEAADALEERITAAIRRMGVDPNALLPRSRVEEAAQAVTERDPDRARQIVRRVAPAAVRSVSRRVLTDPDLRTDAEAYVRAFARDLANRAGANDGPGVLGRLTSDGGRAFMLLDAAIGDLA
ncbi:MAG: tipN [Brevundimonas sp.]|uniref:tipN n=1 Tax=Brevundimonas sp. TaxID=1871086 RepID=UPI00271E98C4|nr:tipN [Brevundimonas sp.]MDO9079033.1 tipN [Brevundimonas sp.]MDP3080938.1 tipN [Brevundimonas sp.]MDZ4060993.1 tipN [Brevundimonas sp.]